MNHGRKCNFREQRNRVLDRFLGIGRNPDDRAAVGSCIAHCDRRLKARYQTFKGVGAGIGDGAQRGNVLQQAAHEVMCFLAEVGITCIIREDRLTVLQ